MTHSLQIDVFSDMCCPWCLIGSARLDEAIARLGPQARVEVAFHPFLLDRDTPSAGVNVREMLLRKHGVSDPAPVWQQIEAEARTYGVPLDLSRQPMAYNSIAAHTVIRASHAKGTQRALHRAILEGYFLDRRNIADPGELAAIAADHGFLPGDVACLLADPDQATETVLAADRALATGVRSVPTVVIAGKHALAGGTAEQWASAMSALLA